MKKTHEWFWAVFPLMVAVALALCMVKIAFPNGDTFFIITTGEYIVENGVVPTVNPFVIHDGFGVIIQQWLFDVLIYSIYSVGGNVGLFLYSAVILLVSLVMMYKYMGFYSENKRLKLLFLAFWTLFFCPFTVARPTSISFLLLLATVMVVESYRRSRKWPVLLLLPVLSLVTINFHASMWPMLFVLILPFIFFDSLPQKKAFGAYFKDWFNKWKLVLLAVVAMFAVGFLNPNGVRGVGYLYLSYGSASSTDTIAELKAPAIMSWSGLLIVGTLLLLVNYIRKHRAKMDFANFYMAAGTIILAAMHNRNAWFLFFGLMPIFFDCFNFLNWKSVKEYKSASIYTLLNVCYIALVATLVLIPAKVGSLDITDGSATPVEAVAYLDELNKDDLVLYTDFNNGAFMEFNGYKVYMDARPELFETKINGKEDVYSEYIRVYYGMTDLEAFIDKYQFTHLVVLDGSGFSGFLKAYDGVELVVDGNGYCLFETVF